MNFDSGVVPAEISNLAKDSGLSYSQLGLLGSLTYVGLVASCPFTGYILETFKSQKNVLIAAVSLNAAAVFSFALSPDPNTLFFARFMIGFSQVRGASPFVHVRRHPTTHTRIRPAGPGDHLPPRVGR